MNITRFLFAPIMLMIHMPCAAHAALSCHDYLRGARLEDPGVIAQAITIAQPLIQVEDMTRYLLLDQLASDCKALPDDTIDAIIATRLKVALARQASDKAADEAARKTQIVAATPDPAFHNPSPKYPKEAGLNSEHGTVVVLVHISPGGRVTGAEVMLSSGYVSLDRAAREAVMHWRFLPATKNGQPVESDMTTGFDFDN